MATGEKPAKSDGESRDAPAGTLQLVAGKIVFHPPERGGRAPTIAPGQHVSVFVNGEPIERPTPVNEGDVVEVIPLEIEPELVYRVDVSADGLEARLSLQKSPGAVVELVDSPPQADLRPRGIVRDRPLPADPTEEAIVAELAERGVTYGIDLETVRSFASGALKGPEVVARGAPPSDGQDAWIEFFFEPEDRTPQLDPATGRVDYYKTSEIPRVSVGTVIAVRHAPKEGEPGVAVTGESLVPKPVKDVKLIAGDGVELADDGNAVVARREGRPDRKGERFSVLPVLTIEGNVGLQTGDIRFRGDIVVLGEVEEQARIEASGRIDVRKDVVRARLASHGTIRVGGNIVAATIVAGLGVVYQELHRGVRRLVKDLESLCGAVDQLKRNLSERGAPPLSDNQLLAHLLDTKFKTVGTLAAKLVRTVEAIEMPLEIELRSPLEDAFRLVRPAKRERLANVDVLRAAADNLARLERSLQAIESASAHVVGRGIHQGEIRATGSVHLQGRGAYHTAITARGDVVINGTFRGGKIETAGDVYVNELGSPMAVRTDIVLQRGKRVSARKLFAGVEVRGGESPWIAREPLEMVQIALLQDGAVQLRSIKSWRLPPAPQD